MIMVTNMQGSLLTASQNSACWLLLCWEMIDETLFSSIFVGLGSQRYPVLHAVDLHPVRHVENGWFPCWHQPFAAPNGWSS
jgi:hypothetical protein